MRTGQSGKVEVNAHNIILEDGGMITASSLSSDLKNSYLIQ